MELWEEVVDNKEMLAATRLGNWWMRETLREPGYEGRWTAVGRERAMFAD